MKLKLLAALGCVIISFSVFSQDEGGSPESTEFLKIFLDCQSRCDQTFFRQEMGFVNFMQNRQEADVFLQLLGQRTGTGGREYRLQTQGFRQFAGVTDTIIFYTTADDTDNQRRDIQLSNIKQAILPFLLRTSLRDKIEYSIASNGDEPPLNSSIKDPWNYWTFNFRINSFLEGESQSNFINLNNSLSINRTTEQSKVDLFVRYNYSRSEFEVDKDETIISINKSSFGRFLYVHSVSEHWSVGGSFGAFASTFSNVDFGFGPDPTIEFNVFPYSESSRHQFTMKYNIGPSYRNYIEETIFDKLSEWFWEHEFEIDYAEIKDWGNLQIELDYRSYLHDMSQMRISLNPSLEWNIAKGLNIDLYTQISYIANLRNIQKSEVDASDILLQNRQLDTSFDYFGSIGLSYRFGSAFNNIVNTRF